MKRNFFFFLIISSLLLLVIETARFLSGENYSNVYDVLELTFSFSFLFEILLKIFVFGWVAFFRDYTNQIDFMIVIVGTFFFFF